MLGTLLRVPILALPVSCLLLWKQVTDSSHPMQSIFYWVLPETILQISLQVYNKIIKKRFYLLSYVGAGIVRYDWNYSDQIKCTDGLCQQRCFYRVECYHAESDLSALEMSFPACRSFLTHESKPIGHCSWWTHPCRCLSAESMPQCTLSPCCLCTCSQYGNRPH